MKYTEKFLGGYITWEDKELGACPSGCLYFITISALIPFIILIILLLIEKF
jgi:hypothetical protein